MTKRTAAPTRTNKSAASTHMGPALALAFHGVRYQVGNVARSLEFYTRQLGFKLELQHLPDFAAVSLGELEILLSGHTASGGCNRVVLRVTDLAACIASLKATDVRFRNEMEVGPGGKQIQIEDPDGNPIELFEPAQRAH
jgi:glyoxylase I family protein